jgi:hypothetical protein
MQAQHRLWIDPDVSDGERSAWECSCGCSGSAPADRVDYAAERHIALDESVVYTNRPPS